MKMFAFAVGLMATVVGLVSAQDSTFSPARPPAIPLAVRSPYLSTWQFAGSERGNGGYLAGQWPSFWTGHTTGWTGLIRVDNTTHVWLGAPRDVGDVVNQTSFEYTASKSIFTMDVDGKVELEITFLSPLYPEDLQRQSLIFSYMNVAVKSTDGAAHSVAIYTDISGEWASQDVNAPVEWDYQTSGDVAYHTFHRQNQLEFSEDADVSLWGDWYYGTFTKYDHTYQSGADSDVRGTFATTGKLADTKDTNFRAINDRWPVFAHSVNFGQVVDQQTNALFSIGLAQDQAVQYAGADGLGPLPSLWKSYWENGVEALKGFLDDYPQASQTAQEFDDKVEEESKAAGGDDYYTITALSARQAFAATQLTGTVENTYMFMKEISSNGNMNTVDVIFPLHTILIYTNPDLLRLLLKPLYENQESGQYPNMYSMHDLGTHYPNATGHPDGTDEKQPLEECGNMLIMTLAYAQRTNDLDYLSQHYEKLKQWNQYLIDEALIPEDQISTDDFAGSLANQTNLALKGMIGIKAMSQIANLTGHDEDSENFANIAQDYITQWQTLGFAKDDNPQHATLSYGKNDTHGLLYNLYADRELGLGFVPQEVYDIQSEFYKTQFGTYGIPLDTRHSYTKADWECYIAAIVEDDVRATMYTAIAKFINETPTSNPFTDLYEVDTGTHANGITFTARPVVGGVFAQLALPVLDQYRQANSIPTVASPPELADDNTQT